MLRLVRVCSVCGAWDAPTAGLPVSVFPQASEEDVYAVNLECLGGVGSHSAAVAALWPAGTAAVAAGSDGDLTAATVDRVSLLSETMVHILTFDVHSECESGVCVVCCVSGVRTLQTAAVAFNRFCGSATLLEGFLTGFYTNVLL